MKSDLNKQSFIESINKLARNKILREGIKEPSNLKRTHPAPAGTFDPINYPYDHVFSFLICNRFSFNFDNIVNEIDSFYEEDIKQYQKHNLILSIKDGLLAYYDKNNKTIMYPYIQQQNLKNNFTIPDRNINAHIYAASSFIFSSTTSGTIFSQTCKLYWD